MSLRVTIFLKTHDVELSAPQVGDKKYSQLLRVCCNYLLSVFSIRKIQDMRILFFATAFPCYIPTVNTFPATALASTSIASGISDFRSSNLLVLEHRTKTTNFVSFKTLLMWQILIYCQKDIKLFCS